MNPTLSVAEQPVWIKALVEEHYRVLLERVLIEFPEKRAEIKKIQNKLKPTH